MEEGEEAAENEEDPGRQGVGAGEEGAEVEVKFEEVS